MITQQARQAVRAVALGCVATLALGACAPDPEPATSTDGATVGVLLAEDLPDGEWGGPFWYYEQAVSEVGAGGRPPKGSCRLPNYALTRPMREGMVAQASAAWTELGDSEPVVWSVASRYEDATATDLLRENLGRAVRECLASVERGDAQASVGGTEEAPVLDELYHDEISSKTWHVRTTWTVLPDDVYVHVWAAWREGHQPPVDVEALLPVAVERAQTLPQTSPRPGDPPACENC